jgi:hypothetical protein
MVEKISKALKVFAALSLQLLSVLLIVGLIKLELGFSFLFFMLLLGVSVLAFLFVNFSLALLKQVRQNPHREDKQDILDEEEINRNKNKDGSIL